MFEALKSLLFARKSNKTGESNKKSDAPASGNPPRINAYIANQKVAMRVTEPFSQELWSWLSDKGWREADIKSNPKKFRRLADGSFSRLARASKQNREVIYNEMLNKP